MSEQAILRRSIAVTFLLAAAGVVFGVMSGSSSIVFDAIYSLSDAVMTSLSLAVSRLIATSNREGPSRLKERFNMGLWHLEPVALGLSGILLIGTATYAFINAVSDLIAGGREISFGIAIVYAVVAFGTSVAMVLYGRRANRGLKSSFVDMDVRGWVASAALAGALLVAFAAGTVTEGTRLAWMLPYIDPLMVALICLVVIPVPVPVVRRALLDLLLVTPATLRTHVDEVAAGAVARHGFLSHRAYVARIGRARMIELYFIVPEDLPPRRLEEWDALRDEIGAELGGEGPDRWLTIAFTTDRAWAE